MAEKANQEGTKNYKAGDLKAAAKCYERAADLAQDEPKYASNLSAALYELGKYDACLVAILRSWKILKTKPEDEPTTVALKTKLATRYAKASLHAVRSGVITLVSWRQNTSSDEDLEADIENFVGLDADPKASEKVDEIHLIWAQWKALREQWCSLSLDQQGAAQLDAEKRLRSLRIFKHSPDPTLEFYHFGHDEIRSLLTGIGSGSAIKLDSLEDTEKDCLSFLFGGSGDCRHVFGTLLDIADSTRKIRKTKKTFEPPRIHMTLVDINPATVAKTLIILELIHRLSQLDGKFNEQMEVQTTLAFLYASLVMPEYCGQAIMDISRELVNNIEQNSLNVLPPWLVLDSQSFTAVLDALRYWTSPLQKSTKTFMELHKQHKSHGRGLGLHGHMPFPGSPPNFDPHTEDAIYDSVGVQLPPKPFQSRHPALEKLVASHRTTPPKLVSAALKEIHETWKPNPTLFDQYSTEHEMLNRVTGYPMITSDPYQTLFTLQKWTQRMGSGLVMPLGCNAFGVQAEFFRHVVEAILYLHSEGKLMIEIVCGDTISLPQKLVAGDLGQRPAVFPTTFSRIWLSNVPDYTNGILTIATHIIPVLGGRLPLAAGNCLLNTSTFGSADDYSFNYNLLNASELPQFLGCRLASPAPNGSLYQEPIVLIPLPSPLPLNKLASKARLHGWLSQLLLCTVTHGTPQPPPRRVDRPNNMVAFFRLLVHLESRVGYPAHWISEFASMIVEDKFLCSARPYVGKMPIPPSERYNTTKEPRMIYLGAWKAEVGVIIASAWSALPFFVPMIAKGGAVLHSDATDILTLRAKVKPIDLLRHTNARNWGPLASPFVMTAGLVFYSPKSSYGADVLVANIPDILEGGGKDPKLQKLVKFDGVQFMLLAEKIDLSAAGVIEWKMSKKWFERMSSEKWKVAVYRTDLKIAASESLAAELWEEIM